MALDKESSLGKINNLVNTFQDMCCGNNCLKGVKFRKLGYTNFTMQEILKPHFGGLSQNWDSDSDGTYHSESGELYSSGDESHDHEVTRCNSNERYSAESLACPKDLEFHSANDSARALSIFQNYRRQYEDDGYSSTDSETSALDLRIERKKTPPKMAKQLPAWVFCTRYSDRPSAGRRPRRRKNPFANREKRSRIAFTDIQIKQLNIEFEKDQYLSEDRRHKLADELDLNEANVKIWFQNKRAKLKKDGVPHPLALQLKEEGLYNHKLVAKNNDAGHQIW